MPSTFNLGAPILWTDWDMGELAALGNIYTYKSDDHATFKPAYMDPAGNNPWSQPIPLNQYGRTNFPIYWESNDAGDKYYIEVRNADGVLIYSVDDYAGALTSGGSVSTEEVDANFVRNAQFSIWDHVPLTTNTGGVIRNVIMTNVNVNTEELICDDWSLIKNAATCTDSISQIQFDPGQTDVPASPTYFLRYNCSVAGTGETNKEVVQKYKSSQFLNGETISFSTWMKADQARTVTVSWRQYFGTGGSPSSTVTTPIKTFTLSTTWQRISTDIPGGFVVPSITGKSIGTNLDDYCYLVFSLDTNTPCTYDFANVQFQVGFQVNDFQQESIEMMRAGLSVPYRVPTGQVNIMTPNSLVTDLGDDLDGYVQLVDQNIARPGVAGPGVRLIAGFNLYTQFYLSYANAQCPVSTGRTAPGNTMAAAIADWNAGKTITVPLTMSRLFGNMGTGAGLTARVAGVAGGAETTGDVVRHTHGPGAGTNFIYDAPGVNNLTLGPGATLYGATATTGLPTDIPDGTSANRISIMNPFSFWPVYIHL